MSISRTQVTTLVMRAGIRSRWRAWDGTRETFIQHIAEWLGLDIRTASTVVSNAVNRRAA